MASRDSPPEGAKVTIVTETGSLAQAGALVTTGATVVIVDDDARRVGQALASLVIQGPGRVACFVLTPPDALADPEQRAAAEAFADEMLGATEVVWT